MYLRYFAMSQKFGMLMMPPVPEGQDATKFEMEYLQYVVNSIQNTFSHEGAPLDEVEFKKRCFDLCFFEFIDPDMLLYIRGYPNSEAAGKPRLNFGSCKGGDISLFDVIKKDENKNFPLKFDPLLEELETLFKKDAGKLKVDEVRTGMEEVTNNMHNSLADVQIEDIQVFINTYEQTQNSGKQYAATINRLNEIKKLVQERNTQQQPPGDPGATHTGQPSAHRNTGQGSGHTSANHTPREPVGHNSARQESRRSSSTQGSGRSTS
jgi:hypothetical protein